MTNQTPGSGQPTPAAMPESSVGRVLQRGGEEILLEKVDDRFLVKLTDPAALAAVIDPLPAEVSTDLVPSDLTEIVVAPAQRDQVMQTLRAAAPVAFASHVYQPENNPAARVYLTDDLTLQFVESVDAAAIAQVASDYGLEQVKAIPGLANAFVFRTTAAATENPLKICNRLIQRADVLVAEPNVAVRSQSHYRPKDPAYAQQWHLHHTGGAGLAANSHVAAEPAWDLTRGVRSVVVAIMDDSVDVSHPDFQGIGKIVAPRDFYDNDFQPVPGLPDDNHGTACAGVAVAEENGKGAVGIAPGCALMPIRTSGFLDDEAIEALFDWAMTQGASVISCSWGAAAVNYPLSLRQRNALSRAASQGRNGKGCVIVFAAGNANRPINGNLNERGWQQNIVSGATHWLNGFAVHPDVIAVAASTSLNRKSAYSNWGREIAVCAPSNNAPPGMGLQSVGYVYTPPVVTSGLDGLGVVTSDRLGGDGYSTTDIADDFGGTSSACPLVAGIAALILSANPDLTAVEVRQILQQTADKIVDPNPDPQFGFRKGTYEAGGRCDWFGYGKVNAFKAVQMALQRKAPAIAASRQTTWQSNTRVVIPDNNSAGVVSAMQVNETAPLRSLQVIVELTHSFMSDLELFLITPTNQTILLQARTLGRRTTYRGIYTPATTPLLTRCLGQSPQGKWQLKAIDHAPGDTGAIQSWQLVLGN